MKVIVDKDANRRLFNTECNSCEGLYPHSMDVRFSKACDNNCLFCIEKGGIQSAHFNIEKMIQSTKTSGRSEILILGGEPFLFVEHLLEYIRGIRPFVDKIYITTALPNTLHLGDARIVEIIEQVDGINCSVHYHADAINNEILNTTTTHSRLKILRSLLAYCPEKIRVMGNLCKGGLEDEESIMGYLKYMTDLGAQEIKLNELQYSPGYYVNFEKAMKAKLPSAYAYGCQRYVVADGYRCLLKRACFIVEDSVPARLPDLFKAVHLSTNKKNKKTGFLVLYEDGRIYHGWVKEGSHAQETD